MKSESIVHSFRWAVEGLAYVLTREPNMRIHLACGSVVMAAGWWLGLPSSELAILILTIGAVLGAECINTAIEASVDLLSPEIQPRAKVAKDSAAAAVLVAAIAAVGIGLLLLGPPLWARIAS